MVGDKRYLAVWPVPIGIFRDPGGKFSVRLAWANRAYPTFEKAADGGCEQSGCVGFSLVKVFQEMPNLFGDAKETETLGNMELKEVWECRKGVAVKRI